MVQLVEIGIVTEMARPKVMCDKCGLSRAGNHYWYQKEHGWRCLRKNRGAEGDKPAEEKKEEVVSKEKPAEKAAPKKEQQKKAAPAKSKPVERKSPAVHAKSKEDAAKKKAEAAKDMEHDAEDDDDDEDVKKADTTKAKASTAGTRISPAEMKEIDADSEAGARAQINSTFPNASPESKASALRVWRARNKETADA